MNQRADSFLLPKNAQSTLPSDAGLYSVNAGWLHEAKADFVCLSGQVKKLFNHAYHVIAVTDGDKPTLLMFSYSASFILNLQQVPLPGKFKLIPTRVSTELAFPGRNLELKESDFAENGSQHRAPSQIRLFRMYPVQQAPRPDLQSTT